MASSTESSTVPGPNGSSIYERTSNADLEKTSTPDQLCTKFGSCACNFIRYKLQEVHSGKNLLSCCVALYKYLSYIEL